MQLTCSEQRQVRRERESNFVHTYLKLNEDQILRDRKIELGRDLMEVAPIPRKINAYSIYRNGLEIATFRIQNDNEIYFIELQRNGEYVMNEDLYK